MADGPAGPDTTFAAASLAFSTHVRAHRIGVAVSGGSDSMALLAMLHRWVRGTRHAVFAATVDHGLRPEARAEAEQVAAFCAARGTPHEILTIGDLGGPGNLSAKARNARYGALTAWADRNALPVVALGHTMDDQAETVLMRLARGSGADGLSGMARERDFDGITWVRPLLDLSREALREWLRAERIVWAEDPSNEDARYDRVKARRALEVLAPLGITAEGISDTADRLSRQRKVLENAAERLRVHSVTDGPLWSRRVVKTEFARGHHDTQLRILADLLQEISGSVYRPRFRSLDPVWTWALSASDETPRTLAGCMILPRPGRGDILIFREHAAQPAAAPASGSWDGWEINGAPEGMVIAALGEAGRLALADHVSDGSAPPDWAKAPLALQRTLPALWSADGGLLAVPHARYGADTALADLRAIRRP